MKAAWRPATIVALTLMAALLAGCPKSGGSNTSGDPAEEGASPSWVVFEVYEAGTGNPLSATVWPRELPDDFETIVQGDAGATFRFDGLGRRDDGWAMEFKPGSWVSVMVWSPGHELKRLDTKIKRGENLLPVELKRTEVEDEDVPERIRLEVLESLPSEGPKSGS
jgi:hypothetical protein